MSRSWHPAMIRCQHRAEKGGNLHQGLDLVFYGDSITEAFRGTLMGVPYDKFRDVPEVFAKHYGRLRAHVFSVAGAPREQPRVSCHCARQAHPFVFNFGNLRVWRPLLDNQKNIFLPFIS